MTFGAVQRASEVQNTLFTLAPFRDAQQTRPDVQSRASSHAMGALSPPTHFAEQAGTPLVMQQTEVAGSQ